ncbi:MAG TPA: MlaD family protein [Opitutaceae bacterium]|mgnify:CR=1 FL=1|nr:MlaD family protein [Opitutaceae bacterium]HRJ48584.1 MlaD family protein [Opitutaceae bacterium]
MKTKVSPAIVGAFVIGAFALGVIALLSFGGISLFSKPQRFTVDFNETIHGLDLGSPVKLRGVRVGRVVDLSVRFDEAAKQSVVTVLCEFNRSIVRDSSGVQIDISDRTALQRLIDQGLRAQLGVIGLATGLLYVELDFADPAEHPDPHRRTDQKYAAVPAMPSAISEFQASFTQILADLKKADIAGLSQELRGLLASTRRQVDGLDLPALAAQWTETGKSANALLAGPEVKDAFLNLNETLSDMRRILARLDRQIDRTGTGLDETLAQAKTTLESFNASALTARRFIEAQGGLGEEAARALARLGEAAESVQRLTDFLERNPNALLTGRKPPQ